jgi:GNAT superfamily N-acetyltransferase
MQAAGTRTSEEKLVKVRTAEPGDIPQLIPLYRHLNPDDEDLLAPQARDRLALLKRYPGSEIFVGELDGLLVTTCTLVVIPNLTRGGAAYALIENVVTSAPHRKRGYGRAVLLEAIDAAWRADCYKVMLLTGTKDPATLKFYRDVGFAQDKTGFQVRRIAPRTAA